MLGHPHTDRQGRWPLARPHCAEAVVPLTVLCWRCCHLCASCLCHAAQTEHGAEVILGVRNTDAGAKLAKEIMWVVGVVAAGGHVF